MSHRTIGISKYGSLHERVKRIIIVNTYYQNNCMSEKVIYSKYKAKIFKPKVFNLLV